MSMLLQELEVWYVLPALRRALASELEKQGLRRVEIAKILGVSKAAVSQYFHKERGVEFHFPSSLSISVKTSATHLKQGSSLAFEMQSLLRELRNSGEICQFHHLKEKDIEQGCNVCFSHGSLR
jgi:predicted transcriptional regulator